jgi:Uncharacterized conserved protein (DUF2190)
MAYEIPGQMVTVPAGSTTLVQFTFVTLSTSGRAVVASNGASVFGVLQNKPTLTGQAASVMINGVSKVLAHGSTVAAGDLISASSVGYVAALSAGDYAVGRVVSGSSGSTGRVLTVAIEPVGTT